MRRKSTYPVRKPQSVQAAGARKKGQTRSNGGVQKGASKLAEENYGNEGGSRFKKTKRGVVPAGKKKGVLHQGNEKTSERKTGGTRGVGEGLR